MLQDEARVNRLSLVFDGVVKVVYQLEISFCEDILLKDTTRLIAVL